MIDVHVGGVWCFRQELLFYYNLLLLYISYALASQFAYVSEMNIILLL